MMKTIGIIRHAKSSWANAGQDDFDRPLNARGEHDAPMMALRLKKAGFMPDLIIASSAKRTKQTAKALAKEFSLDKKKLSFEDELYHCGAEDFQQCIKSLDEQFTCVFIVAHNPGITDFANMLSREFQIDNMPTTAVVLAELEVEHWSDFKIYQNKVIHFDYPKSNT